ncbi:hypothetical protein BJX61DRAFT_527409 [Aspergillus egyptiacus]|nr:hypothetical protein BJX61DRAFT_527409 [Aspergillus egyptiacus]
MAQVCDLSEVGSWALTVSSQFELDEMAESCTVINGSLMIGANYTGSFYLPNLRIITGELSWFTNRQDPLNPREPSPTTIDLPDLEHVGNEVAFRTLSSLTKFSAPRLQTVGFSVGLGHAAEVDLRALQEVEYFSYSGNISSLRLDSLREVRRELSICNKEPCERNVVPDKALDLSLPSLEMAGEIDIDGRYSSLSMPQLRNLTGGEYLQGHFSIDTSGEEVLHLSFPKLSHMTPSMGVRGPIGIFSMPSMKKLATSLHLDTSEDLNITLPFEEASSVTLAGNLTGVQFPNLKSWGSLQVYSSLPMDCGALWESLSTVTDTTEKDNQLICHAAEKPRSPGLSTDAKVGIGVGVGVLVLIIAAAAAWHVLKRRKRTEAVKSESNIHLDETLPTYGEVRSQDHPPEYASTVSR